MRRPWQDPSYVARDRGEAAVARGRFAEVLRSLEFKDDDPEADKQAQLVRMRRERFARIRSGIPKDAAEQVLRGETYSTKALETARMWAEGTKNGLAPTFLVLSGHQGRGKTIAGVDVVVNHGGMFVVWHELKRLHRSSSFNAQDTDEFRRLYSSRLVVLDDFGRSGERPDDEDVAFEFVHARQAPGMYTLITTNLSSAEIRTRFNVYVHDRLTQSGTLWDLTDEPNYRGGE